MSSSTLLLGGIPSSKDLAPSIVFIVLYALAIPLYVWRQVRPQSRSLALIRPGIFVVVRIVMLVMRAIMAKDSGNEGVFIAELVLLTVGFVFLIDPLISAWGSLLYPVTAAAVAAAHHEGGKPRRSWVSIVETVLRVGILVVVITGIVIGTKSSDAIDDPDGSAAQEVTTLRKVNYIVSIVLVLALALGTAFSFVRFPAVVPLRKAVHVVGASTLLLVPCVYKIAQAQNDDSSAWVHTTSAFFVLLITFEYLALIALLVVPWNDWYPSQKAQKKALEDQASGGTSLIDTPARTKLYGQV